MLVKVYDQSMKEIFVLIEGEKAFTCDGSNKYYDPFSVRCDPAFSSKGERREVLTMIKKHFASASFPQTITEDIGQAQAIFRVKSGQISVEAGFNQLLHQLNK